MNIKDVKDNSSANQLASELTFLNTSFFRARKKDSPSKWGAPQLTMGVQEMIKEACTCHDLHVLQAFARRELPLLLPDLLLNEQPVFILLEHFLFASSDDLFLTGDPIIDTLFVECLLECLGASARDVWQALDWKGKISGKMSNYLDVKMKVEDLCEALLSPSSDLTTLPSYELRAVLRYVVHQKPKEVERCLKRNKNLLFAQGTLKWSYVLAKYVFNDFTMFQFAWWIRDQHMCSVILKYLPLDKAAEQWDSLQSGKLQITRKGKNVNRKHYYEESGAPHERWFVEVERDLQIMSERSKINSGPN